MKGSYSSKQRNLTNCDLGDHEWGSWFCAPAGLVRECKVCGESELFKGFPDSEEIWKNKLGPDTDWVRERLNVLRKEDKSYDHFLEKLHK